jgi:hypothetical protein
MDTKDIPEIQPSTWQPIQEKFLLAVLGKLGEETAELNAIICRCIIQGIDATEPVTGKWNRDQLQDEVADVLAMIDLLFATVTLNELAIAVRRQKKLGYKNKWIQELLRERG